MTADVDVGYTLPGFPAVYNGVFCPFHAFVEEKRQYQSTDNSCCVPAELRVIRERVIGPHMTLSSVPSHRHRRRVISSCVVTSRDVSAVERTRVHSVWAKCRRPSHHRKRQSCRDGRRYDKHGCRLHPRRRVHRRQVLCVTHSDVDIRKNLRLRG